MRFVLFLIGMVTGGSALAMWAEVFGLGGNPAGGGPAVAILASVFTVIAIGAYGLDQRLGIERRRRSFDTDEEIAERLTTVRRFPPRVVRDTARLSEHSTIQAWIRALRREHDVQVHIRRRWGTLAVVADGKRPISVILSDGDHSWFAEVPGATDQTSLSADQVEHVTLEALTSAARPSWPEWRPLT